MTMADPDADPDSDTLACARIFRGAAVEAKQAEAHADAARAVRFFGGMVAVCGAIVAAIELP